MITRTKTWKETSHWLALLSITVLVNLPMLSPLLILSGDVMNAFSFFRFAYGELLQYQELPRWLPYLGFGMVFDFNLFGTILPTDYVVMGVGWLLGCRNALLLYKISLILCQCVLILGLYLLSRKFFTSMLSVWLVCLGALLTTNGVFTSVWSLTAYYMVPLLLWFVLRFLESKNPAHLWLAGLTEGLSLLGTVTYIAPLHLFLVVAFLTPFLCREPRLLLAFVHWRNFVHPLFFAFCGYFLLIGSWIAGIGRAADGQRTVIWMAPNRDAETGNVPLNVFLGKEARFERQPLGVMLRMLVKGDLYYGEWVNYLGILPLATLVYALRRRRDTLFLSIAVVCLALFWFALGGWFNTLLYYSFPMMNKYRYISAAWNFLRIFLLLLGGFGFDQLLRDLRGQSAPLPGNFSTRARWAIFLVMACCVLDYLGNLRGTYDAGTDFVFESKPSPGSFVSQNADLGWPGFRLDVHAVLLLRYLAYAAAFGLLWLLLLRLRRPGAARSQSAFTWAGAVGTLLLGIYLADVGFYFSQVVKQSPWCPPSTPAEEALAVHDMIYRPNRYELDQSAFLGASAVGLLGFPQEQGPLLDASALIAWKLNKLPADAEEVLKVLISPHGGFGFSGSAGVLMQADLAVQLARVDLMMAGIKKMTDVRAPKAEPHEAIQQRGAALRRSIGEILDKARMVRDRDAVITENVKEAVDIFARLSDPDRKIIIEGPAPAVEGVETEKPEPGGPVEATFFSANRVEFAVPPGAAGWLFYADAYDPAWRALVDGRPSRVYRANVGFKAVHVPKGTRNVTFYFDAGWRDVHYLALVTVSAVLAFGLTGLLLAAPWVLKIAPERLPAEVGEGAVAVAAGSPDRDRRTLTIWSAFACLTLLAGGLFMGADVSCFSLIIVALAAIAVFIVHNRSGQA